VPTPVNGLASGIVALGAGGYHSCAVNSGGTEKCWGNDSFGQLGIGRLDHSTAPVVAVNFSDVIFANGFDLN